MSIMYILTLLDCWSLCLGEEEREDKRRTQWIKRERRSSVGEGEGRGREGDKVKEVKLFQ